MAAIYRTVSESSNVHILHIVTWQPLRPMRLTAPRLRGCGTGVGHDDLPARRHGRLVLRLDRQHHAIAAGRKPGEIHVESAGADPVYPLPDVLPPQPHPPAPTQAQ